VDLTVETDKPVTVEAVNAAMQKAATEGPMRNVLDYVDIELVSGDYIGNPASSSFDATMTQVIQGNLVKVFSWYDNEWGFSNRMIDLAQLVTRKGL
jgi:glyceraldehyde 3-phosphate dehydrogenase